LPESGGRGKLLSMKTLVVIWVMLGIGAFAQDVAPSGGRIVTRTRTVAIFDDLEHQLMNAVEKKDAATLKSLSTDDFEMRRAADPASPVPRDEWIANELPAYELRSFRISGMAVHLFGENTATVSMNYWQDATVHGKPRTGNSFVVDVWTKAESGWKLAVRYVSPMQSKAAAERKPTGKE
jgi:hypothetical protein